MLISLLCSKIIIKFTLFIFLFVIYGVISTPPTDPIKCSSNNTNCTITNSNGAFPDRSICKASEVVYPTSEAELISIDALASENNRKMEVATRFSHSIPKLACPDDDTQNGLLISTKFLNNVLKIDVDAMTISVESGVTLRQIISEAAKYEMALPYTPYWWAYEHWCSWKYIVG
jgi:L-gulonolactone oxidase